jgi:hypothetical protein
MASATRIASLVSVIESLNAAGDSWGWPAEGIARIAIRRWGSYVRRHPKSQQIQYEMRVSDLAKGLQAHFEPDIPYTHSADWRALAGALADVLQRSAG